MQKRSDRIHFPPVVSHELWTGGNEVQLPHFCKDARTSLSPGISPRTPVICSPIPDESWPCGPNNQGGEYFRERELLGLTTPAKTPSDILKRGPLYLSSSDEDSESTSGPTSSTFAPECLFPTSTERTSHVPRSSNEKVMYHRARQASIRKAMLEFERKMTSLLNWHHQQELLFSAKDGSHSNSSAGSSAGTPLAAPRMRRGRSKLSERLYAAIDNSTSHS